MAPTMTEQPIFRSRTGMAIILIAGVLLIVGLARSVNQLPPESGPAGSSYSTIASGTAGLAALLAANGYQVEKVRIPVAEHPPNPAHVLVVIDGNSLSAPDLTALAEYVESGGRLVAIGFTSLTRVVSSAPTQRNATTDRSHALLPIGTFAAVTTTDGSTVWQDPGSMLPVVGNSDGALVAVERVGRGTVVAISDATIVSNDSLDRADHALLAILAIGKPGTTVRFLEYIHGFEQPTGLAALPTVWKQALVVLLVAGAVWLLAHSRRLGPPERRTRALPPPRATYANALAMTIAKGNDPAASAPIAEEVRAALARRGGNTADPGNLLAVAIQSGVDPAVASRALAGGTSDEDLIARGTVLSQLISKEQL